jgi:two-component system response regulator NreC
MFSLATRDLQDGPYRAGSLVTAAIRQRPAPALRHAVVGSLMKLTTLLVISEEVIARIGLKYLLASESGFEVKGEAGSRDAIQQASKLGPDVVILFAEVTRPSCVQLIASLRKAVPDAGIVVLGRETHHAYVGLLLTAGAVGYILLRATPPELFNAIRSASRGRRYVDPELSEALFRLSARQAGSGTKILSRREQEVLRMFAYGYTLKEIASTLNVSRKSIETYRARSREKLGLRTRADIVRYALQTGLFNDEIERAS